MSEYGTPMMYEDADTDLAALRDRLLESLLTLPPTCFFRLTPKIRTEHQWDQDEVLHTVFYRYSEIKGTSEKVVRYE